METPDNFDYKEVILTNLVIINDIMLEYVATSDPRLMVKAVGIQADIIQLLGAFLYQIERVTPCPN